MKVRLAELVGGLSLATDMGAGLPLQSAIAGTILATRMARRLGLSIEEQRVTYYASILRFIGCSATAHEAANLAAGEDNSLMYALGMCDMADPKQLEDALNRYWNVGADPQKRRDVIRSLLADFSKVGEGAAMHCAQAMVLSRRLPVGDGVSKMLGYMYDRFDGIASNHSGNDIPIAARLCNLASDTIVVLRSLGKQSALDLVLPRKGGQFCPECVDLLARESDELLRGLDAPSCWEAYLDEEPGESVEFEGLALERACTAYADYGDQKSAFMLGHSRRVASSGFLAAQALNLDAEAQGRLRLASLLHDVGRAGVPTGLWDTAKELSPHERQIVESHSKHTETVLLLAPALQSLVGPAGGVHERGNRSGYPRAAPLNDEIAGLLATADVYEALTHERPWRPAYTPDEASNLLLAEAKEGRLPRRAVGAVLDAAGHGKHTSEGAYPAGLSRREVEVLRLLATGLGTKEIADRLSLAPKTAENHIGHIYDKIGARGRAAAALYAVEHGLNE